MRLKEEEIIEKLSIQEDLYRPLKIVRIDREMSANYEFADALIEFSISGGPSFEAIVEIASVSSPKMILQKSNMLRNLLCVSGSKRLTPMIVAPYIGKRQSKMLLEEGISWIDLSGNMLIQVPPNIYIERMGKSNKYPDTAPIKKIFQGISSLVCRALILNPKGFSSLNEVVNFINNRNGNITLATVSKVLKSLEDDLLITKGKSLITVTQPQALLEKLAEGYADYKNRKRDRKFRYDVVNISELCSIFYEAKVDYAFCGFYAAKLKGLAVTDNISILIKSIEEVKRAFKNNSRIATPDEEYGQVTFIETTNPCVWFNVSDEQIDKVVDDLELYLEIVQDAPRGPKVADILRGRILGQFNV